MLEEKTFSALFMKPSCTSPPKLILLQGQPGGSPSPAAGSCQGVHTVRAPGWGEAFSSSSQLSLLILPSCFFNSENAASLLQAHSFFFPRDQGLHEGLWGEKAGLPAQPGAQVHFPHRRGNTGTLEAEKSLQSEQPDIFILDKEKIFPESQYSSLKTVKFFLGTFFLIKHSLQVLYGKV